MLIVLIFSSIFIANVEAMIFSKPIELFGKIGTTHDPRKGVVVINASSNTGKLINKDSRYKYYDCGIARFGEGYDALYAHYDKNNPWRIYFGGDNKNNAYLLDVTIAWQGETIYKINTSEGIVLYLITCGWDTPGLDYDILGINKDGKWFKYVDSSNVAKSYLTEIPNYVFSKPNIYSDVITVSYARDNGRYGITKPLGEFRFKWDDKAQWFGVEKVVY